jgi:hypothetical protein
MEQSVKVKVYFINYLVIWKVSYLKFLFKILKSFKEREKKEAVLILISKLILVFFLIKENSDHKLL